MRSEDATRDRLSGSSNAQRPLSDAWRLEHGAERPASSGVGALDGNTGHAHEPCASLQAENRRCLRELKALLSQL
jgi:hypothetical protein